MQNKEKREVVEIDTLFFIIVNKGNAGAALRKAQEYGVKSGTIFPGEGTIESRLLEKIGLAETYKEILMMPVSNELSDKLYEILSKTFLFSRKNKGIAFSIPFQRQLLQNKNQAANNLSQNILIDVQKTSLENSEKKLLKSPKNPQGNINREPTHYCIMTIVDKGRSKACIKAARTAGARGGTLIHGRGVGVPKDFYFSLETEPQKDILITIASKDSAHTIRKKIYSELELEKVGNGIIFMLPVIRTSGLFNNGSEKAEGVSS